MSDHSLVIIAALVAAVVSTLLGKYRSGRPASRARQYREDAKADQAAETQTQEAQDKHDKAVQESSEKGQSIDSATAEDIAEMIDDVFDDN